MTAREAILGRVREALGPEPETPEIPRDYLRAGHREPAGDEAIVERFAERVADYRATVYRATADELPALVERLTEGERVLLPAAAGPNGGGRSREDDALASLARLLPGGAAVAEDDGSLDSATIDAFDVVVTGCAVAIADTGTIVLDGGAESGRRAITLIPDHHVCVVRADQVTAAVPDAIAVLRPAVDAGRPLTLVSGPSATSDIELERVEGVHGPRRLDVILLAHEGGDPGPGAGDGPAGGAGS